MSQTLTLPDDLYARLDILARHRGLSIEQLLRSLPSDEQPALVQSTPVARSAFARAAALGEELSARYGMMPDSTDLIRNDRAR